MWGLGVDIGKHADPVGIMGVELRPRIIDPNLPDAPPIDAGYLKRPKKIIREYHVKMIEHPPLMTAYGTIEERVVELMKSPALFDETRLVVDIGEVGSALFESWRDKHGLRPIGVRITPGNTVSMNKEEGAYNVGKTRLVSPLMNVFSSRRIRFAAARDPLALVNGEPPDPRIQLLRTEYARLVKIVQKELQDFKLDFKKKTGNMIFEARVGQHDDLVLALALVIWYFEHIYRQHFDEGVLPDRPRKVKDWEPLWDEEDE